MGNLAPAPLPLADHASLVRLGGEWVYEPQALARAWANLQVEQRRRAVDQLLGDDNLPPAPPVEAEDEVDEPEAKRQDLLVAGMLASTRRDKEYMMQRLVEPPVELTPAEVREFADLMRKRFVFVCQLMHSYEASRAVDTHVSTDLGADAGLPKVAEVGIRAGVRLMISVLRSASRNDPGLRREALDFFLDVLSELRPMALWGGSTMSVLLDRSFHSVAGFLDEIIRAPRDVPPAMKSRALKVLLGFGVVRASLPNLLLVVDTLLHRDTSFALPLARELRMLGEEEPVVHPPLPSALSPMVALAPSGLPQVGAGAAAQPPPASSAVEASPGSSAWAPSPAAATATPPPTEFMTPRRRVVIAARSGQPLPDVGSRGGADTTTTTSATATPFSDAQPHAVQPPAADTPPPPLLTPPPRPAGGGGEGPMLFGDAGGLLLSAGGVDLASLGAAAGGAGEGGGGRTSAPTSSSGSSSDDSDSSSTTSTPSTATSTSEEEGERGAARRLRLRASSPQLVEPASGPALGAATDGAFLYVHGPQGLAKVGTGNKGTVQGRLYALRQGYRSDQRCWLACVRDRLYLRSPGTAPHPLVVLDTTTLCERPPMELPPAPVSTAGGGEEEGAPQPARSIEEIIADRTAALGVELTPTTRATGPSPEAEGSGRSSGVADAADAADTARGPREPLFAQRAPWQSPSTPMPQVDTSTVTTIGSGGPVAGDNSPPAASLAPAVGERAAPALAAVGETKEEGEGGFAQGGASNWRAGPANRSPMTTEGRFLYVLSQWTEEGEVERMQEAETRRAGQHGVGDEAEGGGNGSDGEGRDSTGDAASAGRLQRDGHGEDHTNGPFSVPTGPGAAGDAGSEGTGGDLGEEGEGGGRLRGVARRGLTPPRFGVDVYDPLNGFVRTGRVELVTEEGLAAARSARKPAASALRATDLATCSLYTNGTFLVVVRVTGEVSAKAAGRGKPDHDVDRRLPILADVLVFSLRSGLRVAAHEAQECMGGPCAFDAGRNCVWSLSREGHRVAAFQGPRPHVRLQPHGDWRRDPDVEPLAEEGTLNRLAETLALREEPGPTFQTQSLFGGGLTEGAADFAVPVIGGHDDAAAASAVDCSVPDYGAGEEDEGGVGGLSEPTVSGGAVEEASPSVQPRPAAAFILAALSRYASFHEPLEQGTEAGPDSTAPRGLARCLRIPFCGSLHADTFVFLARTVATSSQALFTRGGESSLRRAVVFALRLLRSNLSLLARSGMRAQQVALGPTSPTRRAVARVVLRIATAPPAPDVEEETAEAARRAALSVVESAFDVLEPRPMARLGRLGGDLDAWLGDACPAARAALLEAHARACIPPRSLALLLGDAGLHTAPLAERERAAEMKSTASAPAHHDGADRGSGAGGSGSVRSEHSAEGHSRALAEAPSPGGGAAVGTGLAAFRGAGSGTSRSGSGDGASAAEWAAAAVSLAGGGGEGGGGGGSPQRLAKARSGVRRLCTLLPQVLRAEALRVLDGAAEVPEGEEAWVRARSVHAAAHGERRFTGHASTGRACSQLASALQTYLITAAAVEVEEEAEAGEGGAGGDASARSGSSAGDQGHASSSFGRDMLLAWAQEVVGVTEGVVSEAVKRCGGDPHRASTLFAALRNSSPLGAMVPSLVAALGAVAQAPAAKASGDGATSQPLALLAPRALGLYRALDGANALLARCGQGEAATQSRRDESDRRVVESPHPASRKDARSTEVRIPGAHMLLVYFDRRCCCKEGSAYLQLSRRSGGSSPIGPRYSQPGSRQHNDGSWPEPNTPVVVHGDRVFITYKRTGTRFGDPASWGYRVVVLGDRFEPSLRLPWLLDTQRSLAYVLGKLAAALMATAVPSAAEDRASRFLHSALMAGGLPAAAVAEAPSPSARGSGASGADHAAAAVLPSDVEPLAAWVDTASPLGHDLPRRAPQRERDFLHALLRGDRVGGPALLVQLLQRRVQRRNLALRRGGSQGARLTAAAFAAAAKHSAHLRLAMRAASALAEAVSGAEPTDAELEAAAGEGGAVSADTLTALTALYADAAALRTWYMALKSELDDAAALGKVYEQSLARAALLCEVESAHESAAAQNASTAAQSPYAAPPALPSPPPPPPPLAKQSSTELLSEAALRCKSLLAAWQRTRAHRPDVDGTASGEEQAEKEAARLARLTVAGSVVEIIRSQIPPRRLRRLLLLRQRRAGCRVVGLETLRLIFNATSFGSIRADLAGWLRPALRRPAHPPRLFHAVDSVNGCGLRLQQRLRTSFQGVVWDVTVALRDAFSAADEAMNLLAERGRAPVDPDNAAATARRATAAFAEARALLDALRWRYGADDHGFLDEVGVFTTLREAGTGWGQAGMGSAAEARARRLRSAVQRAARDASKRAGAGASADDPRVRRLAARARATEAEAEAWRARAEFDQAAWHLFRLLAMQVVQRARTGAGSTHGAPGVEGRARTGAAGQSVAVAGAGAGTATPLAPDPAAVASPPKLMRAESTVDEGVTARLVRQAVSVVMEELAEADRSYRLTAAANATRGGEKRTGARAGAGARGDREEEEAETETDGEEDEDEEVKDKKEGEEEKGKEEEEEEEAEKEAEVERAAEEEEEEEEEEMSASRRAEPYAPAFCFEVLALLHSLCSDGEPLVVQELATVQDLATLLSLLRSAPAPHRRLACRTLCAVLPSMPVELLSRAVDECRTMLEEEASYGPAFELVYESHATIAQRCDPLVLYLFDLVATAQSLLERAVEGGEGEYAVSCEVVALLRALLHSPQWRPRVVAVLQGPLVSVPSPDASSAPAPGPEASARLRAAATALRVIGGQLEGLRVGARVHVRTEGASSNTGVLIEYQGGAANAHRRRAEAEARAGEEEEEGAKGGGSKPATGVEGDQEGSQARIIEDGVGQAKVVPYATHQLSAVAAPSLSHSALTLGAATADGSCSGANGDSAAARAALNYFEWAIASALEEVDAYTAEREEGEGEKEKEDLEPGPPVTQATFLRTMALKALWVLLGSDSSVQTLVRWRSERAPLRQLAALACRPLPLGSFATLEVLEERLYQLREWACETEASLEPKEEERGQQVAEELASFGFPPSHCERALRGGRTPNEAVMWMLQHAATLARGEDPDEEGEGGGGGAQQADGGDAEEEDLHAEGPSPVYFCRASHQDAKRHAAAQRAWERMVGADFDWQPQPALLAEARKWELALAILYARRAVVAALQHWPEGEAVEMGALGGSTRFIALLQATAWEAFQHARQVEEVRGDAGKRSAVPTAGRRRPPWALDGPRHPRRATELRAARAVAVACVTSAPGAKSASGKSKKVGVGVGASATKGLEGTPLEHVKVVLDRLLRERGKALAPQLVARCVTGPLQALAQYGDKAGSKGPEGAEKAGTEESKGGEEGEGAEKAGTEESKGGEEGEGAEKAGTEESKGGEETEEAEKAEDEADLAVEALILSEPSPQLALWLVEYFIAQPLFGAGGLVHILRRDVVESLLSFACVATGQMKNTTVVLLTRLLRRAAEAREAGRTSDGGEAASMARLCLCSGRRGAFLRRLIQRLQQLQSLEEGELHSAFTQQLLELAVVARKVAEQKGDQGTGPEGARGRLLGTGKGEEDEGEEDEDVEGVLGGEWLERMFDVTRVVAAFAARKTPPASFILEAWADATGQQDVREETVDVGCRRRLGEGHRTRRVRVPDAASLSLSLAPTATMPPSLGVRVSLDARGEQEVGGIASGEGASVRVHGDTAFLHYPVELPMATVCGVGKDSRLGFKAPGGTVVPRYCPTLAGTIVRDLASAETTAAWVTADGTLYLVGQGRSGVTAAAKAAGSSSGSMLETPLPVPALRSVGVARVVLGSSSAAAISDDGALYLWGRNPRQMAMTFGSSNTVQQQPVLVPALARRTVVDVALSDTLVLAATACGAAFAWGASPCATNLDSSATQHGKAVRVTDLADQHVFRVAVVGECCLALCTPRASVGEEDRCTPRTWALGGASLAVGPDYRGPGLWANSTVFAWGANSAGECGMGHTHAVERPQEIEALHGCGVARIGTGAAHVVALTAEGKAYAWGGNTRGQLGLGHTSTVDKPAEVPLGSRRATRVACGSEHTLLAAVDVPEGSDGAGDGSAVAEGGDAPSKAGAGAGDGEAPSAAAAADKERAGPPVTDSAAPLVLGFGVTGGGELGAVKSTGTHQSRPRVLDLGTAGSTSGGSGAVPNLRGLVCGSGTSFVLQGEPLHQLLQRLERGTAVAAQGESDDDPPLPAGAEVAGAGAEEAKGKAGAEPAGGAEHSAGAWFSSTLQLVPTWTEAGCAAVLERLTEVGPWQSLALESWSASADGELVDALNRAAEQKGKVDYMSLSPRELELPAAHRKHSRTLQSMSMDAVRARFAVIKHVNRRVRDLLPLLDLAQARQADTLAAQYMALSPLVLWSVKAELWRRVMVLEEGGESVTVELNRMKAARGIARGVPDHDAQWTLFGQTFRRLNTRSAAFLRNTGAAWHVKFKGEGSVDAGGPYREHITQMCTELQSKALPLLIPCPNTVTDKGQNREKFVFNPSATSPTHLGMFEFLGKLMGLALRSGNHLNLDLPSMVWKQLVGVAPQRSDLEAIDFVAVKSLDSLAQLADPVVEADLNAVFEETFTTHLSDGTEVELKEGGRDTPLTFRTRHEYAGLVVDTRLAESRPQAQAVRRGLETVVPQSMLSLLTWQELEVHVCGRPVVDVALLRANTEYNGCSKDDDHVKWFWRAMEEYSPEERAQYLRFVWGRSRLPLTSKDFGKKHVIDAMPHSDPDSVLPLAHTCFFSIDLPRYSSYEVTRDRLRYAFQHCQAIDTDGGAGEVWSDDEA